MFIDDCLPCFPRDLDCDPAPLDEVEENEIISIVDKGKKPSWEIEMLEQCITPWSFTTVDEIKDFFKQPHRADKLTKALENEDRKRNNREDCGKQKKQKKDDKPSPRRDTKIEKCPHHGKFHKNPDKF